MDRQGKREKEGEREGEEVFTITCIGRILLSNDEDIDLSYNFRIVHTRLVTVSILSVFLLYI